MLNLLEGKLGREWKMAELRIPREEERREIEKYYECVERECIHVEALLSISYNMFQERAIPRVRCTRSNLLLTPESKICSSYEKRK